MKLYAQYAAIEGPSCKLLDISSVSDASKEKLYCREFRHVSKLIDLFVLPLVRCYPRELLGEWILKLLLPLLTECGYALSDAWLNLLNEGQGHDRLYLAHSFGYLGGYAEREKKLHGCLCLT